MNGWYILGAVFVAGLALRRLRRNGPEHRRNLEGYTDQAGFFHPIRASGDYDSFIEDIGKFTRKEKREQGQRSAADRVVELEIEREQLTRDLKDDPRRNLRNLFSKGDRGDLIPYNRVKTLLGLSPSKFTKDSIIQKGQHKYIRWEYAIDEKAMDLGYRDSQHLKDALDEYKREQAKVDKLDSEIFRLRQRAA